jgi:hypothetical protein
LLHDRLAALRQIADANDTRLLLLLVPANIQVCTPSELEVYPRHVNLADFYRFDLERPQRVLAETAAALGVEAIDLRPILQAGRCLYQPHNMHWLPEAHVRVAEHLAGLLAAEIPSPATTADQR